MILQKNFFRNFQKNDFVQNSIEKLKMILEKKFFRNFLKK